MHFLSVCQAQPSEISHFFCVRPSHLVLPVSPVDSCLETLVLRSCCLFDSVALVSAAALSDSDVSALAVSDSVDFESEVSESLYWMSTPGGLSGGLELARSLLQPTIPAMATVHAIVSFSITWIFAPFLAARKANRRA